MNKDRPLEYVVYFFEESTLLMAGIDMQEQRTL